MHTMFCSIAALFGLDLNTIFLFFVGRPLPPTAAAPPIDKTGQNLSEVPKEVLSATATRKVVLSRNQLATIPSQFSSFAALEYFDVSYNRLTDLASSATAFNGLRSLSDLRLNGNRLKNIPFDVLSTLPITKLDLSHCALDTYPDIGKLPKLLGANLSYNCISLIPTDATPVPALQYLDLSHNNLPTLSGALALFAALTELNVSHNALTELPEDVDGLGSLTTLDASYNQIGQLPSALGNCVYLQKLVLKANAVAELPLEVFGGEDYVQHTGN